MGGGCLEGESGEGEQKGGGGEIKTGGSALKADPLATASLLWRGQVAACMPWPAREQQNLLLARLLPRHACRGYGASSPNFLFFFYFYFFDIYICFLFVFVLL